MKTVLFVLAGLLGLLVLLLLTAVVRTLLMPKKTSTYQPKEDEQEALALAQKLSKMVQVDTTSYPGVYEAEKIGRAHV